MAKEVAVFAALLLHSGPSLRNVQGLKFNLE
jgi:hypothetical protein